MKIKRVKAEVKYVIEISEMEAEGLSKALSYFREQGPFAEYKITAATFHKFLNSCKYGSASTKEVDDGWK